MYKIIGFFLVSILLLSSCGGSSNKAPQLTNGQSSTLSTGSGFEIYTPAKWTQSGSESLPSPYMGNLVFSARSTQKNYGFANNLIILKQDLENIVNSQQYSIMNHNATKNKYLEYEKIDAYNINFGDSDTSRVYIFDAKYNTQMPKLRFIQTAKMCGTTVYLLHFTVALDRSPDNYVKLLQSFQCK